MGSKRIYINVCTCSGVNVRVCFTSCVACCNVLQCVAVCCSVLQCDAVYCSVCCSKLTFGKNVSIYIHMYIYICSGACVYVRVFYQLRGVLFAWHAAHLVLTVLQCVAVWFGVVQCGAVCCSVLQCVASYYSVL